MPLFSFRCEECGTEWTQFLPHALPLLVCACGGTAPRQYKTGVGVKFCGEGWPGEELKRKEKTNGHTPGPITDQEASRSTPT